MILVFNETFQLLSFFDDKDNISPCTKLHICILLLDSGCNTSDSWAYDVMVPLLLFPDTDGL